MKEQLKKLKAQLEMARREAAEALAAEDLEAAKSANDKVEGLKALVAEHERVLTDEAEQAKAKADAEAKAAAEAKAELERLAEEKAAAMVKKLGLDRPQYGGDGDGQGEPLSVPAHIQRIAVTSRYDRLGLLDLATRYHLKARAAKMGITTPPSDRMFRALAVRANRFMNEEDEVPYIDRFGEVKSVKLPAFDPNVVMPWGDGSESFEVAGMGTVQHRDNVTPEGIKGLMDIAVKQNEVVHSTQNNFGDQWVPTLMAAALWRTIRLDARVLGLFDQFDMPSNPYDYPRESTDPTVYGVGETTAEAALVIGANMPIGDSKIGTAKVTFSAGKIGAITFWSEEMNEDSIIAPEPQYRDQFGVTMAHAIDDLLINGDETTGTTNISYAGASITSASKYLKIDGIRHEPLVTTTADSRDGGALTIDEINATRKLMGTDGVNGADPNQLVLLCDIPTSYKFEDLSEVLTVDKFGSNAVILRGQLGSVKGIPIIKSQDYKATDTSGHIHSTGTNNTKGSFCVVNRMGVKVGWKRRPRILIGQVPFSDAWYILALARLDAGFFGAGMVGMSYNLTV